MKSLQKNNNHSFLKNSIENLRKEMIRVGVQEGLSSEKTIQLSQKLDNFIAIYQSMKNI